jgi:transcriptional regulator with XRE-family HTH domain
MAIKENPPDVRQPQQRLTEETRQQRARYKEYSASQLAKFIEHKRESDPTYNWDRLGKAIGLSASAMSLIKNKKMALSVRLLQKVAEELGCNPLDFFPPEDREKTIEGPRESLMVADLRRALKAAARKLGAPVVEKGGDLAIRALQKLDDYPSAEAIDAAITEVLISVL